ncbi:MAG: septum formation inhibitor Maf, partial [Methylobacterium sp.]
VAAGLAAPFARGEVAAHLALRQPLEPHPALDDAFAPRAFRREQAYRREHAVLPKAEVPDEAADCLRLLSGRQHRVFTAICLLSPKGARRERIVESRVRFKRLSQREMSSYLASGEWRGKAGGYAIQGLAGAFVVKLVGSHSAVVGLPLYETMALLDGEGFPVRAGWGAMA